MEESVTLLFSVFVGGFEAGDAVNEEVHVVVDERKALMERFFRNEKGEGPSWINKLAFIEVFNLGTVAYPAFAVML